MSEVWLEGEWKEEEVWALRNDVMFLPLPCPHPPVYKTSSEQVSYRMARLGELFQAFVNHISQNSLQTTLLLSYAPTK